MAKLFALTKILRQNAKTGEDELIDKRTVFDATPAEAKQFDALGSARPASDEEIATATAEAKKADGTAFQASAPSDSVLEDDVVSTSTTGTTSAAGDPKAVPRGKSA